MSRYLGDQFNDFSKSLDERPRSGLRVNTLKISVEQFEQISPFVLGEKVPWCQSAFVLPGQDDDGDEQRGLGKHPYHLAGLYYLQDPSAMSPAELLGPHPGERVLDLAAAPGGKTTHLAALMAGEGLLVANEIKNKRVGHLAQNSERWGAENVVITNESPERLADHFGAFFDRVLVDAPCSGEGMFRKDMGARTDWSLGMVSGCAVRQVNILRISGKLVRPGGYLLYSTCTFAPEEDEGVLIRFLEEFPDYEVMPLPLFDGFIGGKPEWVVEPSQSKRVQSIRETLGGAVRLFPHRLTGEGHFACLLKRTGPALADERKSVPSAGKASRLTRNQLGLWWDFSQDVLSVDLAESRLRVVGDRLYFIPDEMPDFGRLRVVHAGTWLGVFKKDRFEPAHPLALRLRSVDVRSVVDFTPEDPQLAAYLRGEIIPSEMQGWTLVTVDGFGLGWGKGVQGALKNHYPRGWMQI